MNLPFSQATRQARLVSDLGPTELVLVDFAGEDRLSGLFDYRVDALAQADDIAPERLIGTHATVEIDTGGDAPARFDGIVTEFGWQRAETAGHRYRLRLRPWLWLASLRRNQRIFHDKTVVELLEELFLPYARMSSPHLEIRLKEDYPKLEYTVQFQESDMAFACRLMERFGIT